MTTKPLSDSLRKSLEQATSSYEAHLDEAVEYLARRGLTDRGLFARMRLGFVADPSSEDVPARGRLAIPSLGPEGNVYNIRFRAIDDQKPKYWGRSGMPTRLWNLRAVAEAGDVIAITEGELDALTLEHMGVRAVGTPGANSWQRHHPRIFAGFSKVWVVGDGDQPGNDFARKVCESLPSGVRVQLPEGEDVNSLFVKGGVAAINAALGREN